MFWGTPPSPGYNKPVTVASPVGGLNAFDSLVSMDDVDAVSLQNWWPQPYGVSLRKGYVEWTTGLPSSVETLATWVSASGASKLFAWSLSSMYDVSTRGVAGAAMVTGLTSARWESANISNASGNHMIAVNGIDNAIHYKAAGVSRIAAGDGIVTDTWAGLNPQSASMVTVHQHRLWAVEKSSTRGWYLPPDQIQGTFTSFEFGPLFKLGGFLQILTTWTVDDGSGANDVLVAISSMGEAAIYAGTNPDFDNEWGLVGVYYIGAPVSGKRGFCKVGGDLVVLTQQGAVSMTSQLVSNRVKDKFDSLVSKKIQFLISELISTFSSIFGWSLSYFTPFNMLLINVPSVVSGGNSQLAANQITQAWTQFSGMDAACWVEYNNSPYFGDFTGKVYLAWTGNSDKVLLNNTGGTGITAVVQQAFSYLQDKGGANRSNQKQISLYRPVFVASGPVEFDSAIVYDFKTEDNPAPGAIPAATDTLWGVGIWGADRWSGGSTVFKEWVQAEGMGVCASLKMVVASESEVLWVSTDYSLVQGVGIL